MEINECVMCANFGDPRSRDRELRHKKNRKMRFFTWKFINSPVTQKPISAHGWNLYTMRVIISGSCKPSLGPLGTPGYVTKMLQAKNGQKVNNFEPIYLNKHRLWWKRICVFWAHYQPPFFWLCSLTPTWIQFFFFFVFFLTFFFYSFSSPAIYF